jgi:hypothetical protein
MARECIEIDEPDSSDTRCFCGGCAWRGKAGDLLPVEGTILTPGDACPAGRCPDADCGALAYLDRPEDRARDEAENATRALRDLCEWAERTGGWESPAWDRARALLARLDGVTEEVAA